MGTLNPPPTMTPATIHTASIFDTLPQQVADVPSDRYAEDVHETCKPPDHRSKSTSATKNLWDMVCVVPNSEVGDGVTCCLATLAWLSYSFSLGCAPRNVIILLDSHGVYRATQRGVVGRSAADVWNWVDSHPATFSYNFPSVAPRWMVEGAW